MAEVCTGCGGDHWWPDCPHWKPDDAVFAQCEGCGKLIARNATTCEDCEKRSGDPMLEEHRVAIDFCLKNSLHLSDRDSDFLDMIDERGQAAPGQTALTVKEQMRLREIISKLYKKGVKPK